MTYFYFSRERLAPISAALGQQFREASPFPHVTIPNFLPVELALQIAGQFPGPADIPWKLEGPGDAKHTGDPNVEKLGSSNEELFPPLIRHVMYALNSSVFLNFLQDLTGHERLAPDPSFRGCGMHSTGRGGRLMIHADASRHPNPLFDQILNLIYYVTPNWESEWGGELEMWDKEAKVCVTKVQPTFNTALIFFTGSEAYHGHPLPLMTPPGVRRNSLAAYYYTVNRERSESYVANKDYVEWIKTNELDNNRSLVHITKSLVRAWLPSPVVNRMASITRSVRRKR